MGVKLTISNCASYSACHHKNPWQGRRENLFSGGLKRKPRMWGTHGECRARAYNGGLWAEPRAGSRGRTTGQGAKPLKLKGFQHRNVQNKGHFGHFWEFFGTSENHYKLKLASCAAAGPKISAVLLSSITRGFSSTSPPCLRP